VLFKPDLCALVMAGKKTQTRRAFRPDDDFVYEPYRPDLPWQTTFTDGECVPRVGNLNHDRFEVGKRYAVQPGRGKRGVGHLIVTEIRYCARAGDISEADARAEGFGSVEEFRAVYARINGAVALDKPCWALTIRPCRS
jgi:hypothetical protein